MLPKGDPNNNDTVREFARAVLSAEPTATGGPIAILQSGDNIIDAFYEAGLLALLSITLLLWITLRRPRDVGATRSDPGRRAGVAGMAVSPQSC